jgi:acyl-CoA thioesterase
MQQASKEIRMSELDVEGLNAPGFNKYTNLMGIEFTSWEAGKASARLEVREDHFHPGGIVHGGVAFSLADSAMAHALIPTMEADQQCSTIELKISFLSAVKEGTMTCNAWIVKRGRSVAFLEAEVLNGDKPIARASASFAIIGAGG